MSIADDGPEREKIAGAEIEGVMRIRREGGEREECTN
jgi:hypothetical protein